jgi:hypothetical protein
MFDLLYRSRINNVPGRAAVYYIDLVPGQDRVTVTTRWLRKNRDVERLPAETAPAFLSSILPYPSSPFPPLPTRPFMLY